MKRERASSGGSRPLDSPGGTPPAAATARRRRRRWLIFRLVYLLIVLTGAIVLWLLVPEHVKKAVRETYFNRT